ncbi:MAG: phosphate acyltransferase PlsX [Clostridia bacterium]|nr:phosphate acyltransferase PlsX [Clostridia bacterium]
MNIIIDAFGGDLGPRAAIDGALMAMRERSDISVTLSGDEEKLKAELTAAGALDKFSILHAPTVVDGHDDPTSAVKAKADSSMMKGLRALSEGKGDAFISAGNTGALFSGGTLIVKRLPGVKRGALAPLLPGKDGFFMLIDAGANIVCTPQMLLQFGVMGSVYMRMVKGIKDPKVGLLNVGSEDTKGTELQLEAYKLLKAADINFIGNIEGRDVPYTGADVVVTDGFTGNVTLKLYEGLAKVLMGSVKDALMSGTKAKLGAMMAKDSLSDLKKRYDYKEVGGTAFLGLKRPVFKTHGSSDARTFYSTIINVSDYVKADVTNEIKKGIEATASADEE